MSYVIRFDFPETQGAPMYAGLTREGLGWAWRVDTAEKYETAEAAERVLANGYASFADFGRVLDLAEAERGAA